jgi:hypothetical protein
MAKPPALVVSALATWNGKALAKGSKQISEFDKSAQKLGKTFAKYLGATALVAFGKSSVNAFIESEKAAAKLRTTVDNLGLSFEQKAIDDYLKRLSLQYGIIDENLIPGFQRLLIVTKDVAKAQSIFQTALDVSAGTGKDLTSVSTSLSKAYLGDNVALGRLGVGLSKAQLKSSSFLDVQKTLNSNFAGQASAAVAGYAGDMAKLTVAVDESKEAIGKGLLDALRTLSGDTSIDTFTAKMVGLADTLGRFINNAAGFAKVTANIFNIKDPNFFRVQPKTVAPGASTARVKDYQLTVKTTAARKAELAILTASNKSKTAIDQLKDKFDLERIGLTVALNAATDEETKLRIRAQLAILDNNEALAKKILAEMNGVKAVDELSTAMNTAAKAILTAGQMVLLGLGVSPSQMAGSTISSGKGGFSNISNLANVALNNPNFGTSPEAMGLGLALGFTPGGSGASAPNITVNVDATNMVDPANMTKVVQESLLIISKNGYSTVPAGQGF